MLYCCVILHVFYIASLAPPMIKSWIRPWTSRRCGVRRLLFLVPLAKLYAAAVVIVFVFVNLSRLY
jgi:hypothetical protein